MLRLVFFISFECEDWFSTLNFNETTRVYQSERWNCSICKVMLYYMVKIMSLWQQSMLLCTCGVPLLIANTLIVSTEGCVSVRVTRVWYMFRESYKFLSDPLEACSKRWSGGFCCRCWLCAVKTELLVGLAVFPKIILSFCGLKCSFQTLAGPCMPPWESRPCLDLVYLVFNQRGEARRMSVEEGKKRRKRKVRGGKRWLPHPFAPPPLCSLTLQRASTLWYLFKGSSNDLWSSHQK